MKWFKHFTGSLNDDLIFEAMHIFGSDAVVVFFGTLDILADEFDIYNPGESRILIKKLTQYFQLSRQKTTKILKHFDQKAKEKRYKNKSFCVKFENDYVVIRCQKLKEICDTYTEKQLRKVRTKSGQDTNNGSPIEAEVEAEVEVTAFKKQQIKFDKDVLKNASTKKIKEDIELVCEKIYQSGKFRSCHAFVNSMLKEKKNPRAILHTMTRILAEPQKEHPWAYCKKIIEVENGNYNEADYTRAN